MGRVHFFILFLLLISGCDFDKNAPEHFKITALPDGRVVRLDIKSGDVVLLADNRIIEFQRQEVQLVVGKYYKLENGELVPYLGNKKFGDDINLVIKKYSSKP